MKFSHCEKWDLVESSCTEQGIEPRDSRTRAPVSAASAAGTGRCLGVSGYGACPTEHFFS